MTKRINAIRGTRGKSVWQRNYYEQIIRNEAHLNRVRQYIDDNPAWLGGGPGKSGAAREKGGRNLIQDLDLHLPFLCPGVLTVAVDNRVDGLPGGVYEPGDACVRPCAQIGVNRRHGGVRGAHVGRPFVVDGGFTWRCNRTGDACVRPYTDWSIPP